MSPLRGSWTLKLLWRSASMVEESANICNIYNTLMWCIYHIIIILILVYFRYFPPFHRRKDAMTFQLITTQHQLSMCLVVELRGDIQALGFVERIARVTTDGTVTNIHLSEHQPKFRPMHFLPCRLHLRMASITWKCCLPVSSAIMQLIPYIFLIIWMRDFWGKRLSTEIRKRHVVIWSFSISELGQCSL